MIGSEKIFLHLPLKLKEIIGDKKNFSLVTHSASGTRIYKIIDPHHKENNLYLKINSIQSDRDLLVEAKKLKWLQGKLPVPEILFSDEINSIQYLLLTEIKGLPLCDHNLQTNLLSIVKLFAQGLKMIHSIEISDCPFDRTLNFQIESAFDRINKKLIHEENFDKIRRGKAIQTLFQEVLETRPSSEELVFTHGDYCLPNVIIKHTLISGFIDLGNAGIADRYQDIALGARSIAYNFGEQWVPIFFQEYGIAPINIKKLEFYQLLDEFF